MKKLAMLVLAAALMLALTACGGKEEAGSDDTAAVEPSGDAAVEPAEDAKEVVLVASDFKFEQEEYRVAKGETITFTLENSDGFHGVSIKKLDVDLDNNKSSQTVTIDKAGTYEIVCSVVCGTGHSKMKSSLVVE